MSEWVSRFNQKKSKHKIFLQLFSSNDWSFVWSQATEISVKIVTIANKSLWYTTERTLSSEKWSNFLLFNNQEQSVAYLLWVMTMELAVNNKL